MSNVQTNRQVRIVATNGDENMAVVLNQDNNYQRQRDRFRVYYEKNKPALLEYSHNYYKQNRQTILEKKRLDNAKKETKDRKRQYYLNHKEKFYRNGKRNKRKSTN